MQKLDLKKIRIHLDIERLPTLTLYASLGIAAICLLGSAWFTYKNVYIPYTNNTVPEEKLNQKQDKLNIKDFDNVRVKLDAKQKSPSNPITLDPFRTVKP